MADIILELENIRKSFGDTEVLKGIGLRIEKGEFITFLGASGCGKTTTLRIIAGLESPDEGTVRLNGRDVTDTEPNKRNVNTVFQNYALFPHMDVFSNIAYGLRLKKVPKKEIAGRVEEMLELVQLSGYEKRMPSELSGGQRQRVAIARAVINNPQVLLLDEPLGALDLQLRRQMQVELKRIQKRLGITFLYITHDQEEALNMSDRIVVMQNGRFEQIGTPDQVYHHPKTSYVARFVGTANIITGKLLQVEEGIAQILVEEDMAQEAAKPGIREKAEGRDVAEPGTAEKAVGREAAEPGIREKAEGREAAEPGITEKAAGREAVEPGIREKAEGREAAEPGITEKAAGREAAEPSITEKAAGRDVAEPGTAEKVVAQSIVEDGRRQCALGDAAAQRTEAGESGGKVLAAVEKEQAPYLSVGQQVTVAVRSENMRLSREPGEGLRLSVIEKNLAGGVLRISLDGRSLGELTASRQGFDTAFRPGDVVTVNWEAEHGTIVDLEGEKEEQAEENAVDRMEEQKEENATGKKGRPSGEDFAGRKEKPEENAAGKKGRLAGEDFAGRKEKPEENATGKKGRPSGEDPAGRKEEQMDGEGQDG